MEKELNKNINDLVNYIKNTNDYKKCIQYKKLLDEDKEIKELIKEIKRLQKILVNTNDLNIKEELDKLNKELYSKELFIIYNQYLDKVNYMIDYVKEDLNDYFYKIFNN